MIIKTKIKKRGNSLGFLIPKKVVEKLNLTENLKIRKMSCLYLNDRFGEILIRFKVLFFSYNTYILLYSGVFRYNQKVLF